MRLRKLTSLILCLVFTLVLISCKGEEAKLKSNPSDKSAFEEFMKEKELTLTAKDVQYDMINTLDQSFALEGIAELSDYYNYGFPEATAKLLYVIKVTPTDKKYKDSWYIYCDRESFKTLFTELKEDNIHILVKCIIPKDLYQKGQGNMALAEAISW